MARLQITLHIVEDNCKHLAIKLKVNALADAEAKVQHRINQVELCKWGACNSIRKKVKSSQCQDHTEPPGISTVLPISQPETSQGARGRSGGQTRKCFHQIKPDSRRSVLQDNRAITQPNREVKKESQRDEGDRVQ